MTDTPERIWVEKTIAESGGHVQVYVPVNHEAYMERAGIELP